MELKSINRSKTFIPEFLDNKKQPEDKQIKVTISRFPSGGEMGLYKTFRLKGGSVEVVYVNIDMMISHVGKIENLSIGGVAIDDGIKLCDHQDSRLYDLIVEIRSYLLKDSEELEQGE